MKRMPVRFLDEVMSPGGPRRPRDGLVAGLLGTALLVTLAGITWLVLPADREAPAAPPAKALPAHRGAQVRPVGITQVATLRVAAPRYASPGRRAPGFVPAKWYGRPSVLPVIEGRPGWVRVRLAQRPNGSTAWLRASDVTLSSTPYRIVIALADDHLHLYDRNHLVMSAPAGVGVPADPTPAGEFFVAFDESPPPAEEGYGPFIMVTSAHSPAISDWQGTGDAVVGIHGPLGEDGAIGTTGARITHGCIRLHDQALVRLRDVPPGTPVDIIR